MIIFLNPKEVYNFLSEKKDNIDLIDIRSLSEYEGCHLPGATLLSIDGKLFSSHNPNKEEAIFYCATSTRTMDNIDEIEQLNYQNHYILLGGIVSWRKLLLPVCIRRACKCAASSSQ